MSVPVMMKFPPEFAETLRARSELVGCFPAQYVQAMFRLVERKGLQLELLQEIAQVRSEAERRHREGSSLGGQNGPSSDYLSR